MAGKEIKTFSNVTQQALYPVTSKTEYICANAPITRGITTAPSTLDECFRSFSGIKDLAVSLGFLGLSGSSFIYTLWSGATAPPSWPGFSGACGPNVLDVFFNEPSKECNGVSGSTDLGKNWLGCLWGTPDAPFSCSCPDVGPLFHAYLKLRLNVATFWNTPKNTPVRRAEFLDAIKYGKKANITVAGDFKLKIGQVVYLNVNGVSGFPYSSSGSKLNGYYYIIGVKHVITNGGGHETAVSLTEIPPITDVRSAGSTFAVDYP